MGRRFRRCLAVAGIAAVAGALPAPTGGAAEKELSFSIKEARAYGFRVPLRPEVIEAAGLRDQFDPCDPQEDPYGCDPTRYNHRPNCPPDEAVGRRGAVPRPQPVRGSGRVTGGAGDEHGAGDAPARSSPIALNDLVALGTLGRVGASADATGMASSSYVDLSGRQDPEAHAESDAFTGNAPRYEERCTPRDGVPEDYVHVLSRSAQTPATSHLAECHGRECTFFGGAAIGSDVERGGAIVDLAQRGDRVVGRMEALLKEASWGGGQLRVELLRTVVTFEADGTAEGLTWSVATTAEGVTLGGRPIALPPGRIVGAGGLQVGVAAPYVEAAGDGSSLEIVAPGLLVAHEEQSAFFAGAELSATFGRQAPGTFTPGEVGGGTVLGTGTGTDTGGTFGPGFTPGVTQEETPAVEAAPGGDAGVVPEPAVQVVRFTTGAGPMAVILGLAAMALVLLLSRWIGRYRWGRRLYAVQPFRGLDWLYRAFLKT
ncbi:MAG: hypothetical protein ACRDI0_03940 [Actinomycetota bacterium]